MSRVTISSSIPLDKWELCNENHWKWQDLILMGIQAKLNMPNLLDRQKELEKTNEEIAEKLRKYALRVYELEEEIKNVRISK